MCVCVCLLKLDVRSMSDPCKTMATLMFDEIQDVEMWARGTTFLVQFRHKRCILR